MRHFYTQQTDMSKPFYVKYAILNLALPLIYCRAYIIYKNAIIYKKFPNPS